MKKLLAFLALLVCVLSAPQLAKAWDKPESLYFFKDTGNGNGTSYPFSQSGNSFTYTVDATNGDVLGVIINRNVSNWNDAHSSNTYLPTGYSPNNDGDHHVVNGAQNWYDLRVYSPTWSKYCLKFESGKKYSVTITYDNGRIDGKIEVGATSSADFTTNTNPTAVEFEATNRGKAKGNFTYVAETGDYNWYFDFIPTPESTGGYINFRIKVTYKDGTTKTFGADKGSRNVNVWVDPAVETGTGTNYQGEVDDNKYYRVKLRAYDNDAKFQWKIIEVKPITAIDLMRRDTNEPVGSLTKDGNTWSWNGTVNQGNNQHDSNTIYYLRATLSDNTYNYYSIANSNNEWSTNSNYFINSGNSYKLGRFANNRTPGFCFNNATTIESLKVTVDDAGHYATGITFTGSTDDPINPTTYDDIYINGFEGWKATGYPVKWDAERKSYFFTVTVDNEGHEFAVSTTKGDKDENNDTEWGKYHAGRYAGIDTNDNDTWNLVGGVSCKIENKKKDIKMRLVHAGTYNIRITRKAGDNSIDGLDRIEVMAVDAPVTNVDFEVLPKAVREADGDWSVLSEKNFAYVQTGYLNNNRKQPDWEMTELPDGTFEIKNVTLRNKGDVTVKIYTFDGRRVTTLKEVKGDPKEFFKAEGDAQYGKPFNIRTNGEALVFEKLSDIPPFISMVGYNFQQLANEATPNSVFPYGQYSNEVKCETNSGWQESWVLYGPQGEQMRDTKNKLLYSTQWPPVNPIYFNAVKLDSDNTTVVDNMEMSSENLILRPTYKGAAMTRKEWSDSLNLKSPDFYKNLWNEGRILSNDGNSTVSEGSATPDLSGNQHYVRYVVNNMWILGSTKFWTGWTGGGAGTNNQQYADWGPYMNWGIHDDKQNGNVTAGYRIDTNSTYTLKENKSNFRFENPTYFKTVELFLPVDENGVVDLTNKGEGARLYTTPSLGDAYIRAQAHENRTGKYVLGFDLSKFTGVDPSKVTVKSWKVTRYDATESDMTSVNPDDWTPVGTRANAADFVVKSGDGVVDNVSEGIKFNTYNQTTGEISEWNIVGNDLTNGRYFYGLHIVFDVDGKEVYDDVMSNVFSVANYEFDAVCVPLQLIKLNLPDTDEKVSRFSKYDGKYLTYRPARTGRYYIVDTTEGEDYGQTITLDDNEANDLIKTVREYPRYYTWTAKYYVAGFDGNNYASVMRSAVERGLIEEGYTQHPYVYIDKVDGETGDMTADVDNNTNRAVRSTANRLYGRLFDADGSLEKQCYQARIQYRYTPKGEADEIVHLATAKATNNSIIPVVPKTYAFGYKYEYDTDLPTDADSHKPDTKVFETKSDITGELCTVNVLESDYETLRARNCHARVSFKQPNVEDAILKRYNIYYDVTVTNRHNGIDCNHNFTTNGIYHDPSEATRGNLDYEFLVKNVYPDETHQPILRVNKVEYRVVDSEGNTTHVLEAKYPSTDYLKEWTNQTYFHQEIEAVNEFSKGRGRTLGELTIGIEQSPALVGHVQFRGHKDFDDTGSDGITAPGDGEIGPQGRLVPHFYHIESQWTGRHSDRFSDTEVVDAVNFPGWTQKSVYYSVPTLWNHKAADADADFKKGYYWNTILYPVVPKDVTMEEIKAGLKVTLTPLYLFYRHPSLPSTAEAVGLVCDEIKEEPTSASVPAKAPAKAADQPASSSTPSADGQYVILRGTPAEVGGTHNNFGGTTGVENVIVDSDNTVEYYNIQGMRILNPVKGQVYVVRRGTTVTKELY